jgi:hypothetical protein
MEPRDVDQFGGHLLVDYSGNELEDTGQRHGKSAILRDAKQDREIPTLDQETKLMRAMNEIRQYSPKNMSATDRERFGILCENIFKKHGITPEYYRQHLAALGTQQTLRR